MSYQPKPGDRIRAEIDVKGHPVDPDYRSYQIDASTIELIEPLRTPGQRAYEAFGVRLRSSQPDWADLSAEVQAEWEKIAAAARGM